MQDDHVRGMPAFIDLKADLHPQTTVTSPIDIHTIMGNLWTGLQRLYQGQRGFKERYKTV